MGGRSGKPRTGRGPRATLRAYALTFPGAWEDFPWGESVVKAGKKVFLFLGHSGDQLGLSMKLPSSSLLALDLPFTTPTGYGLARGGWVTATFEKGEAPPVGLLCQWIEESYRAVAPKRSIKELDALPPAVPR